MRFVLAIALFLVPMVVDLALMNRLTKYRIDLRPFESPYQGASMFWQVNILRRRNYYQEGQRLLTWLYVWFAVTACCMWGAGILIVFALSA